MNELDIILLTPRYVGKWRMADERLRRCSNHDHKTVPNLQNQVESIRKFTHCLEEGKQKSDNRK